MKMDRISLDSLRRSGWGRPSKRPFGSIPKRRSYLIVCEGERTEPNYFKALAKILPRNMVENVVVEGVGGTPDYLLKFAKAKIAERDRNGQPPFYHVWLVFDRDNFEHFTDTIEAVDRLNRENSALPSSRRPLEHWHCAWSNEAFEIWYILHFREQLGGGVSRERYGEMITEDVRKRLGLVDFKYVKNDIGMFTLLYPFVSEAIDRAERALQKQIAEHGDDIAAMCPATYVHRLVRDLLAYLHKGQR